MSVVAAGPHRRANQAQGERSCGMEPGSSVVTAPGHTWYAAAFLAEIDGRRVAVVGDAVSRDADGRFWGGGPVYRNRLGMDDFSATADLLLGYEPAPL